MRERGREEAYEEIRAELRARYPNLHLHVVGDRAVISGTFPVRGPDDVEIDSYQVSIELPDDYPESLPIVRETGGRIPWQVDFHVEPNGRACVILPDDRWRSFPVGARFSAYLAGPLHNFFLSQTAHAETGQWPFGEWGHGKEGIFQHYRDLLGTRDDATVRRFLLVLAKLDLNRGQDCPCGSGKKVKRCCAIRIADLRSKVSREAAARSLAHVNGRWVPPEGGKS